MDENQNDFSGNATGGVGPNNTAPGSTKPNTGNVLPHRWQKGQSGNPAGKPIGTRNRASLFQEWLDCDAEDGQPGTQADQLVRTTIRKAQAGDLDAARFLFDNVFGKMPDKVESSGPGGGPIITANGQLDTKQVREAMAKAEADV